MAAGGMAGGSKAAVAMEVAMVAVVLEGVR